MHHEDIKAAIRKSGSSPSAIARCLEVAPATVSNVLKGRTISARIAKQISGITGIPFRELWPGKYPAIEFVESMGVTAPTAQQAEADLKALKTRRRVARKVAA